MSYGHKCRLELSVQCTGINRHFCTCITILCLLRLHVAMTCIMKVKIRTKAGENQSNSNQRRACWIMRVTSTLKGIIKQSTNQINGQYMTRHLSWKLIRWRDLNCEGFVSRQAVKLFLI